MRSINRANRPTFHYDYVFGYILPPTFFMMFLSSVQRDSGLSTNAKDIACEILLSISLATDLGLYDDVGHAPTFQVSCSYTSLTAQHRMKTCGR